MRRNPRGVTLVELLVVVTILVLLAAMVVPNITPTAELRRLREAARGVDTFLNLAKAAAVKDGRPVGVMLTPSDNNGLACLTLSLAQIPDPYPGTRFDDGLMLSLTSVSGTVFTVRAEVGNPSGSATLATWQAIRPGDLVQIAGQGPFYTVDAIPSTTVLTLKIDTYGAPLPWPDSPAKSAAMPFQVHRQPVAYDNTWGVGRTSGAASVFQLPPGLAIDLEGSYFPGVNFNTSLTPPRPVTIVFAPSGGVSAIYANNGEKWLPAGTIHLLIGKIKKIPAPGSGQNESNTNWYDLENFWVSIRHQTGQVGTHEMAPVSGATNKAQAIEQATFYTRDTTGMGGQ